MLDYSWRMYDPDIARFTTADPLMEITFGWSPYRAFFNNPLKFIDPNGQREWPVNETYNGHTRSHLNNYGEARGNRLHQGLDINLGSKSDDLGAPVYATHDGVVTRIARIDDGDTNSGGNRIQITYGNNEVSTYYMHLESINDNLAVGFAVTEGTQIGTLGGSGKGSENGYVPHLHYELNVNGQRVNPATGENSLIDPQAAIAPMDGGTLPSVTIETPRPYNHQLWPLEMERKLEWDELDF